MVIIENSKMPTSEGMETTSKKLQLEVQLLLRDKSIQIILSSSIHLILEELFSGQVLRINREEHGLYLLKKSIDRIKEDSIVSSNSLTSTISNNVNNSCSNSVDCVTCLWHKRLGHAPLRVLRIIGSLNPMEFHDDQCIVCPIVKKSRLPSPSSNSLPLCASDIVHVDLW
ncbi:hypothetical protein AABB24_012553, partial [Solanum stoloniferum]